MCPRCKKHAGQVKTNYKTGRRLYVHDTDNVCSVDTLRHPIDLLEGAPEEGLALLERANQRLASPKEEEQDNAETKD